MSGATDFWADGTSVIFTSFWGWSPETWAAVGWSNEEGRAYRDGLRSKLTDPFITVVYVTRDPQRRDLSLVGKIVGFYLVSHEKGDRDEFTHPAHHGRFPEKWRHSLRALRAFSYISDPLPDASEFEPALTTGAARAIARWGKELRDKARIECLRETPWCEVPIYRADLPAEVYEDAVSGNGMVQAGPAACQPYIVSPTAAALGRRLYVFRLEGDTDAYLGESAAGRRIYKIGLSASPDARRRSLQKAMPMGAFTWEVERTSRGGGAFSFSAAVAAEYAMKVYLAKVGKHLGGEFYLASEADIDKAWRLGVAAAQAFGQEA